MRNKTIVQLTGSKVTHMPHPFNEGALCGKTGGTEWEGGHYETFPEVTCKNCKRTIPQAKWSTLTVPYRYTEGAWTGSDDNSEPYKEIAATMGDCEAFWFPSADNDGVGILAIYGLWSRNWYVYTI
jgi:hypothetical protein